MISRYFAILSLCLASIIIGYVSLSFAEELRRKQSDVPVLPMSPEDDYVPGQGMPYAMDWNRWVWHNLADPIPLETFKPTALSGGTTTTYLDTREAFSAPLANLDSTRLRAFAFGRHLFRRNWVTAPASVESMDGLGPTFNRVSCSGCHLKDGRGQPPKTTNEPMKAMVVRLSIPGVDSKGGPAPHPVYGSQLQNNAILGVPKEGRATISYLEVEGAFLDGKTYSLREPIYEFGELGYGPLGDDTLYSPRVAPATHGLGLIEAIAAEAIEANADPQDQDGNGVSGRVNRVWDAVEKHIAIGRFGWKANVPSLHQQVASAAAGDMGITTSIFPTQNCPSVQDACLSAPGGGTPELDDQRLERLVLYARSLAVPARRNIDDPTVRRGEALFAFAGCDECHKPNFQTGEDTALPELANQNIYPYTDLLLHDMGAGLADGRPDYEASGREWRTPPLWGIGLVYRVNLHRFFLHDGRARGLMEAILWHDGEAKIAREEVRAMRKSDREALIAFLRSL